MQVPAKSSPAESLALLPASERLKAIASLTDADIEALAWDWRFWARPNQIAPTGDWLTWLILAGRGFGKTRSGAEWVRATVCGRTPLSAGRFHRIALVAETAADARDVMVEGVTGILAVHPKGFRPLYEPSKRRVTWPNGAVATLFNAVEPDQLRGPQFDAAWSDELCLIAGTSIETSNGPVPIERLRSGTLVWTRLGLRRVVRAWCSSPNAEIWELASRKGRHLIGTGNHPVWVGGKGFVPLREVLIGDTLLAWHRNGRDGAARHGTYTATITATETANSCIPAIERDSVAVIRKLAKKAAVFNLEVEGAHEFFANGLLAHNCKWRYARDTWDMLQFGLRLGEAPQQIVTTTPKPIEVLKEIIASPDTVVTGGSTHENKANLAPPFFRQVIARYEGTRLGRQELNAEIIDEAEGALWSRAIIEKNRIVLHEGERVAGMEAMRARMKRIVVALDPAATSDAESAEHGLVVAGLGHDGHGYILEDLSGQASPDGIARKAIAAYDRWQADRIVGEVNNGGEWIGHTIAATARAMHNEGLRRSAEAAYTAVHASRGKQTRAEPVSALDEQGRVHHVGSFPEMEDQLCEWEPLSGQRSPDRLDARVWALTELMLGGAAVFALPEDDVVVHGRARY